MNRRAIATTLLSAAAALCVVAAVVPRLRPLVDPAQQHHQAETTPFGREVADSFAGSRAERIDLAARLSAWADGIEADGDAPSPKLYWAADLVELFDKLTADSPPGAAEAVASIRRGLVAEAGIKLGSDTQAATPEMRQAAAGVLREAAGALD